MITRILVVIALIWGVWSGGNATHDYTDRHAFAIAVLLVGAAMAVPP